MSFLLTGILFSIILVVILNCYMTQLYEFRGSRGVRLPGPRGFPWLGPVHMLSSKTPWITFHEWAKTYGSIYQVKLAGKIHVWVSDEQIAHDLLAKRGAIYSDRPHIAALIEDNRTSGRYLPLLNINELWNRQRKFTTTAIAASSKAGFHGHPELESKRLLKELVESPAQYSTHLESFVARTTCRLAWNSCEASDELKQRAQELLYEVSPNGSLGNKLPFLMLLPDYFSRTKMWERRRMEAERLFFETMQQQSRYDIELGKYVPSWTASYLDDRNKWGFDDDVEGAYVVGVNSIAGALTIAVPMQSWCLAMCDNPWYLDKLHAEIDRVCGEKPPMLSDWANLPFLRATIRETMRWRPAVPTGIPHELAADDYYRGFHIPAGSIIHPLEWSMTRNADKYPHAEDFNPERWLSPLYPTYREPLSRFPTICYSSQFGFGRRICQGQEIVEAYLFIGIGAIAWACNIRKELGFTRLDVSAPEPEYTGLLIAKPKPLKLEIEVRSHNKRQRIMETYLEEKKKGSWKSDS